MTMRNTFAGLLLAGLCCCLVSSVASAVDLTGAWADDVTACNKVFVKKGKSISFARDADMHGSGLIIEKNRIRGKIASCSIKSQKQDGDTLHLIGICSTDVALQTVQLTLKIDGDSKITRIFPGVPELQMDYSRCSF